jgi:hypothetical protein
MISCDGVSQIQYTIKLDVAQFRGLKSKFFKIRRVLDIRTFVFEMEDLAFYYLKTPPFLIS